MTPRPNPQAVAASHGRAFVIDYDHHYDHANDDDDEGTGENILFVIDIQSGDIIQIIHVDLKGEASAILVVCGQRRDLHLGLRC